MCGFSGADKLHMADQLANLSQVRPVGGGIEQGTGGQGVRFDAPADLAPGCDGLKVSAEGQRCPSALVLVQTGAQYRPAA